MLIKELLQEDQYNFAGKKPGPLSNGSTPTYYFKTSTGSEYILFSGGELLRNKSEQNRGDTGLQPISEKCIFVYSKTFGQAVADVLRNLDYKLHRTIRVTGGIVSLLVSDKGVSPLAWRYMRYEELGGSQTGRIESKCSLSPVVGFYVCDYDAPDATGIHMVHPGHQVMEVATY